MPLIVKHDPDSNALYWRLRSGRVDRTIALDQDYQVYADLDQQGRVLGVEFVDADTFAPFLRAHAGVADLAARLQELAAAAS